MKDKHNHKYKILLGQPLKQVKKLFDITYNVRIIKEGSAITSEVRTNRINLVVDKNNKVVDVFEG